MPVTYQKIKGGNVGDRKSSSELEQNLLNRVQNLTNSLISIGNKNIQPEVRRAWTESLETELNRVIHQYEQQRDPEILRDYARYLERQAAYFF
ncbi:hypothetical protein D6745_04325 [Candidatus Woesearchaeota archaeon]|nr:MAG: hypothetical protein D6745_04325 [Candidatus Woesearchaeota archaeon]